MIWLGALHHHSRQWRATAAWPVKAWIMLLSSVQACAASQRYRPMYARLEYEERLLRGDMHALRQHYRHRAMHGVLLGQLCCG